MSKMRPTTDSALGPPPAFMPGIDTAIDFAMRIRIARFTPERRSGQHAIACPLRNANERVTGGKAIAIVALKSPGRSKDQERGLKAAGRGLGPRRGHREIEDG